MFGIFRCRAAGCATLGAAVCLALSVVFQGIALFGGRSVPAENMRTGIMVRSVSGWSEQELPIANSTAEQKAVLQLLSYDKMLYKRFTKSEREFELLITHWKPGSMPVDKVAAHTPDACWPGAGWELRSKLFPSELREAALADPAMQYRIYEKQRSRIHTIFFHKVDGRSISYGLMLPIPMWERMVVDPRSWFRQKREQFFVRLTSRDPLADLLEDSSFRMMLRELADLGAPL